jgi:hypothetical protein
MMEYNGIAKAGLYKDKGLHGNEVSKSNALPCTSAGCYNQSESGPKGFPFWDGIRISVHSA